TFIDSSGEKSLYYGEKTAMAVYKMNTGTTDADSEGGTSTISVEMRTPHYTLSDPTIEWRISMFYVKYKSSSDVVVANSINKGNYSTLDTLSSSSTVTVVKILPKVETQGFTHGLKFTTSGTITIEAVGFKASPVSFGKVAT
ncbi:MAG: hypothetical protein ACTSPI_17115, partial [Candidatus Heimdallarchaeaceae archaeon]